MAVGPARPGLRGGIAMRRGSRYNRRRAGE